MSDLSIYLFSFHLCQVVVFGIGEDGVCLCLDR